jgi:hypothetical protein
MHLERGMRMRVGVGVYRTLQHLHPYSYSLYQCQDVRRYEIKPEISSNARFYLYALLCNRLGLDFDFILDAETFSIYDVCCLVLD